MKKLHNVIVFVFALSVNTSGQIIYQQFSEPENGSMDRYYYIYSGMNSDLSKHHLYSHIKFHPGFKNDIIEFILFSRICSEGRDSTNNWIYDTIIYSINLPQKLCYYTSSLTCSGFAPILNHKLILTAVKTYKYPFLRYLYRKKRMDGRKFDVYKFESPDPTTYGVHYWIPQFGIVKTSTPYWQTSFELSYGLNEQVLKTILKKINMDQSFYKPFPTEHVPNDR